MEFTTEGVFVSGLTFQVIRGPGARPQPNDSDDEAFSEPEPEPQGFLDTEVPEVYEELFGYKRKAGRPNPGTTAAAARAKAKAGPAKSAGTDGRSGGVAKVEGRPKPPKAPKAPSSKASKADGGISVKDMLDKGLFQSGLSNVTVACKGVTCTASLTAEGHIKFEDTTFDTPNAFSHFIKSKLAHNRPGGDGWRFVHVDGVCLHDWRARMQGGAPAASAASKAKGAGGRATGPKPPTAESKPPASGPGRPTPSGSARAAGSGRSAAAAALGGGRRDSAGAGSGAGTGGVKASPSAAALPSASPAVPAAASQEPSKDVAPMEAAPEDDPEQRAGPSGKNWVQCADCCTWRSIPEQFWAVFEAADEQEWFCKDATWDVTQHEPFTPACGSSSW